MANHLIIGLGGTGGQTLKCFREQLIDKYNSLKIPQMDNVKTLWVDSSEQELKEKWFYNGHDLSLGNEEKLLIQGHRFSEAVNGEPIQPQYEGWIGKPDNWGFIGKNKTGEYAAGGQVRRLGRFNFSQFVKKFNDRVATAINSLRRDEADATLSVHVVAGLAGGTGSGAIIDATAQIAKEYGDVKIFLYLVTPEQKPDQSHIGNFDGITFYYANGYAALKELNAYSTSELFPYDLTNTGSESSIIKNENTANGVFLFSEKSEQGGLLFHRDTLIDKMSNLLFLRAVTVETVIEGDDNATNGVNELGRLFGGIATLENDFEDPQNNWGFGNQFHVMGTQGLAVPKQQIKSYIGSEFITNAFNKILYNNFEVSTGYLPQKTKENKAEKLFLDIIQGGSYSLDEWYLSINYLTLQNHMSEDPLSDWSSGNESAQGDIRNMTLEIFTRLNNEKQSGGKYFKDKELFRHLKSELSRYMSNHFRRNGLSWFFDFRQKKENINRYAKFIAEFVKSKIFNELSNDQPQNSLSLDSAIDFLAKLENEYRKYLSKNFEHLKSTESNKIEDLQKEIGNLTDEYVNTFGLWPRPRRRERLITKFQDRLIEYWSAKTALRGITFGIHLTPVLFNELRDLRHVLKTMRVKLEYLRDGYDNKIKVAKGFITGKNINAKRSNFDCANSEGLDLFLFKTKESEANYAEFINSVRDEILNFKNLLFKGETENIEKAIERIAFKTSDEILSAEKLNSLLETGDEFYNVHIVDLLNKKYHGMANDPNLREIFDNMTAFSSPMMEIKNSGNRPEIMKYAILPIYDRQNDDVKGGLKFHEELKQILIDRGFKIQEGKFKNEIIFVQAAKSIKLNQLERVDFLRKKYAAIVEDPKHRNAKFLLHIQDSSTVVDLIEPGFEGFLKGSFPYLWMLEVVNGFDKVDGKYAIINKDNLGNEDINNSIFFDIDNLKVFIQKTKIKKVYSPNNLRLIKERVAEKVDTDSMKTELISATIDKIDQLERGTDEWDLYQIAYNFIQHYDNTLNREGKWNS